MELGTWVWLGRAVWRNGQGQWHTSRHCRAPSFEHAIAFDGRMQSLQGCGPHVAAVANPAHCTPDPPPLSYSLPAPHRTRTPHHTPSPCPHTHPHPQPHPPSTHPSPSPSARLEPVSVLACLRASVLARPCQRACAPAPSRASVLASWRACVAASALACRLLACQRPSVRAPQRAGALAC